MGLNGTVDGTTITTYLWECPLLKRYTGESVVCLSTGMKLGERRFLRPEEVDVVSREIEIIKRMLQASIDRQKKYTQNRRQLLEFEVGDQVFLKVSSMRGVMRFGKKRKLNPRYVESRELNASMKWHTD